MPLPHRSALATAAVAALLLAGQSTAYAVPSPAATASDSAAATAPALPPLGDAALVEDLFEGALNYTPASLEPYAGELYFASITGGHPRVPAPTEPAEDVPPPGLWAYNALTDTTRLISAFAPDPTQLTVYAGRLYFSASDGGPIKRLWSYDAATQDLRRESAPAFPDGLTVYGGRLYFSAQETGHGRELWAFDAATGRSVLAADIRPGPESSDPGQFLGTPTVYAGRLYFSATGDPATGSELWSFDARTGRADLVADLNPGPATSTPSTPVVYDNRLFFSANDGVHGSELWWYDAVTGETALAAELEPGADGSDPGFIEGFTVYDDRLFFNAEQRDHGIELYVYDAATGSADLAAELSTGRRDSAPGGLTVYAGRLYFFAAADGFIDFVLFAYDAATGLAAPAGDVVACSYAPRDLTVYAGDLYFCGYDGEHGEELWRFAAAGQLAVTLDPGATPVVVGPGGGTVTFDATVTNLGGRSRTVQLWTEAVAADGSARGPLIGPRSLTLAPGETYGPVTLQAVVPASLPPGRYLYRANAGTFPSTVLSSGAFVLVKRA